MKILHIHQDYPDGRPYPSTKAVYNLLHELKKVDTSTLQYVLSINRTSNPFKISFKKFEDGYSLVYWALPVKFIYKPLIYFWTVVVYFILRNLQFDLIHGHKLTTEGLFTYFLAKKTKSPYFISVRGSSDIRNIKRLSDCRSTFSNILNGAQCIFWVSPWAKKKITMYLNTKNFDNVNFPNICRIENINSHLNSQRCNYLFILSYHQYIRKGLLSTLCAISKLKKNGCEIILEVIGDGDSKIKSIISDKIVELGIQDNVRLLGQLPHNIVLEKLHKSKGMLLPALNETFGMSYIESLANGAPILYMANTGIDGFFSIEKIGVKVNSQNIDELSDAIIFLEKNNEELCSEINKNIKRGFLDKFTGNSIVKLYLSKIEKFRL
ncbi:glycosyltransferase family 4 protein [Endozoicomonas sp. 2B-B]